MTFEERPRARDRDAPASWARAHRALKRQLAIDDGARRRDDEPARGMRVAADEDGDVLVWIGAIDSRRRESQRRPSSPHPRRSRKSRRPLLQHGARRAAEAVMFCDLVGSTPLASRVDPEDLRDLVRAYQAACDEEIRRYDGYVAQYLGDGILAYFGWPVAQEDAAERAVRAGFAAVYAVARTGTPVSHKLGIKLSMRVGLHTGVVVVGEVGAGEGRQNLAMGEAPNVAARVQALAEPDTVLLDGDDAEADCRQARARRSRHRSAARRRGHPSALPRGRRERRLGARRGSRSRRTRKARARDAARGIRVRAAGRGGVMLISGEAGIGKSRLTRAARRMPASR